MKLDGCKYSSALIAATASAAQGYWRPVEVVQLLIYKGAKLDAEAVEIGKSSINAPLKRVMMKAAGLDLPQLAEGEEPLDEPEPNFSSEEESSESESEAEPEAERLIL